MSKYTIKNLTIIFVVLNLVMLIITSSSLPFLSSTNNNTIMPAYAYDEDNNNGDIDNHISNTSSNANGLKSSSSNMPGRRYRYCI
jgi:hypothetical protein